MANSGSFNGGTWKSSNPYNTTYQIPYIQIETENQNISSNTTTITFSLKIHRNAAGSVTWKSSAPYGSEISGNCEYGISSFRITNVNVGENIEIFRRTFTIVHNGDGTCDPILIYAYVDLSGTTEGVNEAWYPYQPPAIQRASKIVSSASWTAGNNLDIFFVSSSRSFCHQINIYLGEKSDNHLIGSINLPETSNMAVFNSAEFKKSCFTKLGGRPEIKTIVELKTYQGNTLIGEAEMKSGICKAPKATTPKHNNLIIGENLVLSLASKANPDFTHKLNIGFEGISIDEKTTSSDDCSFILNPAVLYSKIPSSMKGTGTIKCTTYYKGVQVQQPITSTFTASINAEENRPEIGYITCQDLNVITSAITGNSKYIVQNESILNVFVSGAVSKNSSFIRSVNVSVNGISKSVNSGTSNNFNMGKIDVGHNIQLTVTATDSRGLQSLKTEMIPIIPYSPPIITESFAVRKNGYGKATEIYAKCKYSPLTINGDDHNFPRIFNYRYKKTSETDYEIPENYTNGQNCFIDLENNHSYSVHFHCEDHLNHAADKYLTVSQGTPAFFISEKEPGIGICEFSKEGYALNVKGSSNFIGTIETEDLDVANLITSASISTASVTATGHIETGSVKSSGRIEASSINSEQGVIAGSFTSSGNITTTTGNIYLNKESAGIIFNNGTSPKYQIRPSGSSGSTVLSLRDETDKINMASIDKNLFAISAREFRCTHNTELLIKQASNKRMVFAASGFDFNNYNRTGYAECIASKWNVASDERYKSDITIIPVIESRKIILKMEPIEFTYTSDKKNQLHRGFSAQKVQKALNACNIKPCIYTYDQTNDLYSLDKSELIPDLVNCIKDLYQKNRQLMSRLQQLENKINGGDTIG